MLKTLHEWDLQKNIGWPKTVRDYLSGIGLMDIFLNERSRKPANIEAFVFIHILNLSKLLVSNIHEIKDRISMTKLRLSHHKVMIEKGRHDNIETCNRFCSFCPNCLEDEYHFLMLCPASIFRD